uniref:Uncharacterized protein n=1 Tax=Magallana gigas TaxID=29159 RepID=K1PU47_MAGGI
MNHFERKCPFFDNKKERMAIRQCQGKNCPSEEIYSPAAVKCGLRKRDRGLGLLNPLHVFDQSPNIAYTSRYEKVRNDANTKLESHCPQVDIS